MRLQHPSRPSRCLVTSRRRFCMPKKTSRCTHPLSQDCGYLAASFLMGFSAIVVIEGVLFWLQWVRLRFEQGIASSYLVRSFGVSCLTVYFSQRALEQIVCRPFSCSSVLDLLCCLWYARPLYVSAQYVVICVASGLNSSSS